MPKKLPPSISEEWRPVVGFPKYEVSNLGRVRSYMLKEPRVLSPCSVPSGHMFVVLTRDRRPSTQYVHRLVCIAWRGQPLDGYQAAHLDGNPKNNVVENLIWATPKENNGHKILHGTLPSKFTPDDIREITRRLVGGHRPLQIARDYGVGVATISSIKFGRTWAHLSGLTPRTFAPQKKLREPDVQEIMRLLAVGERQQRIADRFGVNQSTVRDIKFGKSWRSVTGIGAPV